MRRLAAPLPLSTHERSSASIEMGNWTEAPAFEDQLPDEWLPKAFFAYWCPESRP